ncbi:unnamed protein product [Colias eurytheme]|nr:unnamed protein product [Colias eurytheme]
MQMVANTFMKVFSPAAGRASTSGSTSNGSSGSRMGIESHAGACGALASSPAAAALRPRRARRRRTCAHRRRERVPASNDTRIRAYHRCCPIGESPPTDCKCTGVDDRKRVYATLPRHVLPIHARYSPINKNLAPNY